jgi:thymidine kinase
MSKLWFRYGVMLSSKSLQLLAVAHNYEVEQGKKIITFKPKRDDRSDDITSRAGLSRKADYVLDQNDLGILYYVAKERPSPVCVLVEEAQFFTKDQIDAFADVSDVLSIPVICYGLKTDFQMNLFEGSQRLLEIADKIEEIKTTCYYCVRKAIFNLRMLNGTPIFEGNQIVVGDTHPDIDGIEYRPVCRRCYRKAQGRLYHEEYNTPLEIFRNENAFYQ